MAVFVIYQELGTFGIDINFLQISEKFYVGVAQASQKQQNFTIF